MGRFIIVVRRKRSNWYHRPSVRAGLRRSQALSDPSNLASDTFSYSFSLNDFASWQLLSSLAAQIVQEAFPLGLYLNFVVKRHPLRHVPGQMRRGLNAFLCTLEFCPLCPWYRITGSFHLFHTSMFPLLLHVKFLSFILLSPKAPLRQIGPCTYMCFQ